MADAHFSPMNPFAHPSIPSSSAASVLTAASDHRADEAWDHFLQQSPLGQFQQPRRWAAVKSLDGWKRELILLDPNQLEAGGLQLLWRSTRIGRIGYVSKGPVLAQEDQGSINLSLDALHATARSLRLRALILQPPDQSQISAEDLGRHHFSDHSVPSVIHSTATIPLCGDRESVLTRMSRQVRWEVRAALRRGAMVRRGDRTDLPHFFELMCESSRRQKARPNPSRVESLETLWDRFNPKVFLNFTRVANHDVAGLLMIGHGRRLTIWKKGWNSEATQFHASCLLMVETLVWASENGYSSVDLVAIDPGIARTVLSGVALSGPQLKSRDLFHLRLGAQPKLLPPARVLILNPRLRKVWSYLERRTPLAPILMRRLIVK